MVTETSTDSDLDSEFERLEAEFQVLSFEKAKPAEEEEIRFTPILSLPYEVSKQIEERKKKITMENNKDNEQLRLEGLEYLKVPEPEVRQEKVVIARSSI